MLGDIRTGKLKNIFTDKDEAWLEMVDEIRWLNDGQHFIWISERDGWRHVYLVKRDGKEITCLTPGEYDVISMVHIDEEDGWLYFTASLDTIHVRAFYIVSLSTAQAL